MALILMAIGMLVLVAGYEGTFGAFMQQLGQDMPGFAPWAFAVLLIGMLGYVKEFEGVSNALMFLTLLVIVLGHKQIWANLKQLATSPPQPAQAQQLPSAADQAALAAGPTINIGFGGGATPSGVASGVGGAAGAVGGFAHFFGF